MASCIQILLLYRHLRRLLREMRITGDMTDETLLRELGGRIHRLRLNRNFSQAQLAREAGISKRTLERLEKGSPVQLTILFRVGRKLGFLDGLQVLVPEPQPSPLQLLKLQGQLRQRAGTRRKRTPRSPER